jgi:NtrC-family two-component system sensor histidine kinase KinB
MRLRHLRTRFLLAGCLLVATTVGCGLWSAFTFARLSAVAGETLRAGQEAVDLSAELAGALEREDDALVLAMAGDTGRAERNLAAERRRGEEAYARLLVRVGGRAPGEGQVVAALRAEIDRYRAAASGLVASAGSPGALERYHRSVNPLLRQAVASCGKVREENFRSMQAAGVRARDEARRATWVVAGVSLAAIVLATLVSVWLAGSVVPPVRELTASVEAVRLGDFDRRVALPSADELGQLAQGFNRMARALADYRRSNLGDLLAAKTTLEATLNALPDAVIVVSPDGTLAALNPRARAVLEVKGVAAARTLRELPLPPEHREAVASALAGRPAVPPPTDFGQALGAVLGGRPHKFLLTALPIPEFAPGRTGAVIVLDDVTEFARLDELRGELIGVASHELKTPLTALRMNLLLLAEQADDLAPRQREMLAAAAQGCEELGGTIDELLDVTRVEAGQLRLDLAPVDFSGVLDQARRGLDPRYEDARVRLHVEAGRGAPLVWGDAARLRTVFVNLLTNALKYSPPGGTVTVRVVPGPDGAAGGRAPLHVSVADAGPGIPAEYRERVFEKFFRVEHHLAADGAGVRGTGIGLYLCREIIKAHGGSIWCEANDGAGTRVCLTLPTSPPDAAGRPG